MLQPKMPQAKLVVGLGEGLVRLHTPGRARLEQAGRLDVSVAGAELNVLAALVELGCRGRWVTRLPANPLGRLLERGARACGVETAVDWEEGGRAGLFFTEAGAVPRPAEVLYDRAGSSASKLAGGQLDWERLLAGAACLHTTGITCALGDGPHAAAMEALAAARERGLVTSFDVNFRSRLWSPQRARARLLEALPLTTVLFASGHDVGMLLGLEGAAVARDAEKLRERHGIEVVVLSGRSYGGRDLVTATATAVAVAGAGDGGVVSSRPYEAEVVDPFGSGDAAAAGFLAAHLAGEPLETAVDQAARLAALMHTIEGDLLILRGPERHAGHAGGRRVLR